MAKRGRPMGPVLIAVLDLLRIKNMTAREVSRELKLSVDEAKNACRRLHDAEIIYIHGRRAVIGVNKAVRVYAAVRETDKRPAMMRANHVGVDRK